MRLLEGMRQGDLEDIVLPLISVDEYVSKIDNNSVVFGFFAHDAAAANDLNRFVQKSPYAIIDTEVSPAPDQQGYYIVFFEMMNDDTLVRNLENVLAEVAELASVKDWQFRVRTEDDLWEWDEEMFEKHFSEMRSKEERKAKRDPIREHLYPSNLKSLSVGMNKLVMEGMGYREAYEWVAFGDIPSGVASQALDMSMAGVGPQRRLTVLLGEGWDISKMGDHMVVRRYDGGPALVLKPIRDK